jgi:hypothetical protein
MQAPAKIIVSNQPIQIAEFTRGLFTALQTYALFRSK